MGSQTYNKIVKLSEEQLNDFFQKTLSGPHSDAAVGVRCRSDLSSAGRRAGAPKLSDRLKFPDEARFITTLFLAYCNCLYISMF